MFAVEGGTQALLRTLIDDVRTLYGRYELSVPDELGALVLKGAAHTVDARDAERHLFDAAVLAACTADPVVERDRYACSRVLRGGPMTVAADRVTRVASDLFDSAAVEGARQSRSAKQQLDYWARVGREVTFHQSAARSRIESVFAGDQPISGLTSDEHLVLNAEIDAEIDLRMVTTDFGAALDQRGVSTVSLDDQGRLVEHRTDGSHVVVAG